MPTLVLFDIDETMISSDGAGRRAISKVLNEHWGVQDHHMQIVMSGKTDPQILREILSAAEMKESEIDLVLDKAIGLYLDLLESEIQSAKYYMIHPGVPELIAALEAEPDIYLGLLTGNVERGARMKLAQFDLNKHFDLGSYGSDSANRLDLPAIARERAEQHFGIKLEPSDLVIIGDAINDILCAKGFGAKCIAVNTGKTSWADLEALKPDYLFKSLADTETIISAIKASHTTAQIEQPLV